MDKDKDKDKDTQDTDKLTQDMDRLTKWRQREFLAWTELLKSYDLQWCIMLSLKDYDCHLRAVDMLLDWTRELCTEEHIQVGYFYIYCENHGHAHIHALMVGSNADGSRTLLDVSRSKWERRWPAIAGIQIPKSNDDVSRYLALHQFRFKCINYPFIEFYNRKLLKRFQRSSE